MKKRTVTGMMTATLLLSSVAATAYAFCRPSADIDQSTNQGTDLGIDLGIHEVGEPIAVGLDPILSQDLGSLESEYLPEAIANAIIAQHAQLINAPSDAIRIDRSSRQTWSDGCLGLGGPAESCLLALTEGWQVIVIDSTGEATTYRTNLQGDSIRREPKTGEAVLPEERPPLP